MKKNLNSLGCMVRSTAFRWYGSR